MKSLFRFLLFLIWIVSFSVFVFTFAITRTALNENYLKEKLVQKDFYVHLHSSIPAIASYFETETEDSSIGDVTPEQLGRIITGATEPGVLKVKTEILISDIFTWMVSPVVQNPAISIADLNNALLGSESKVLDAPLELLKSGEMGIKFPDKIEVPLPVSLKNLQFIIKNKIALTYGAAALGILSILGFVLLKSGSVVVKLHSAGETLFWSGLVTAIFFGSFWGFFTAGGSLAKGVTESFKIPQAEINYIYSLISSVITDYTVLIEIFCLSFFILGLTLWVATSILIKKNHPGVVPEKAEAKA